jgi:hypothetical protein
MGDMLTYWGITSQIIVEEAEKMGLQIEILCKDKNFFRIKKSDQWIYFKSNDFGGNSSL